MDNRENIIYFENLANLLERLEIENERVGDFFSHFGNIYYHLGLYQKAEPLYLKALIIREKILGEEHPDTASSYNNFGRTLSSTRRGIQRAGTHLFFKSF